MPSVSQQEVSNSGLHCLVVPFPVACRVAGGFTTAVLNQCENAQEPFLIISADTSPTQMGKARIIPVQSQIPFGEIDVISRQVLCGAWQLLHPHAYLPPALSKEIEREVFQASSAKMESLDQLIRFLEHHMERGRIKEEIYNQAWVKALTTVPDGCAIHWHELFLSPAIEMSAEDLRSRGCPQTLHVHEPIPESLALSEWGRSALRAISKVDAVYLHADVYRDRLRQQLDALGLRCPEIRRFDLGVDFKAIEKAVTRFSAIEKVQNLDRLRPDQHRVITDIFQTRERVPHRFMCLDRADPIKGTLILLQAIETFLDRKIDHGVSIEELTKMFRFYLLQTAVADSVMFDEHHLNVHYERIIARERARLEARFPSIFLTCSAIDGDHRELVPALLVGCHTVSASVEEGLHLVSLEGAWVNTRPNVSSDCTVVLGSNAGFALQVLAGGDIAAARFPQSGSVEAMVDAITSAVADQVNSPGTLRRNLERLVQKHVAHRTVNLFG